MRIFVLATSLVLILTLVLFAPLLSIVEARRDDGGQRSYEATVTIKGLPRSLSTTVFLDGHRWGKYRGDLTLKFDFLRGTTHTISVDPIVNGSSGVSYVCKSNIATFSGPGPAYSFNYTLSR